MPRADLVLVLPSRRGTNAHRRCRGLLLAAVLLCCGCGTTDSGGASAPPARSTGTGTPSSSADATTSANSPPTPTPTPTDEVEAPDTIPTAPAPHHDPAGSTEFVVVGDSLTAGNGAVAPTARPGVGSWISGAIGSPLVFAGGWAVPGAATADMVDNVLASDADELVVLAGTNDLLNDVDPVTILSNVADIVLGSGVSDVLVVALPPLDSDPSAVQDFNPRLQELAAQRGWGFLDPWQDIGDDGSYLVGTTLDGVHPTPELADLVGERIRAALLAQTP